MKRRVGRHRKRLVRAQTVVFFAASAKEIPIPTGAGYEFTAHQSAPSARIDPPRAGCAVPALRPNANHGVAVRFWQVSRAADKELGAVDEVDQVIRSVIPRAFVGRGSSSVPVPRETFDLARTVVEMATRLRPEPQPLQAAFNRCVGYLEDVHRAYVVRTQAVVHPLTTGDLGVFALVAGHTSGRWNRGLALYVLPGNVHAWSAPHLTTSVDYEGLNVFLTRLRAGDPFALFAERLQRARTSYEQGEFSDSTVHAAIACEVLLDGVLGMLLWEDGDFDAALVALAKPLAERVRSEYHVRLGGTWQAQNRVLGAWVTNVAYVRGRIVHRGWRADAVTAAAAARATSDLEAYVGERVLDRRNKYMRTTLLMFGEPGLRRRGLWRGRIPRWLATSAENPDEWNAAYSRWRAEVDAALG